VLRGDLLFDLLLEVISEAHLIFSTVGHSFLYFFSLSVLMVFPTLPNLPREHQLDREVSRCDSIDVPFLVVHRGRYAKIVDSCLEDDARHYANEQS